MSCLHGESHQPKPGTCYTALGGLPANLMVREQYPVEGMCMHCGKPIRCERFQARQADTDWVLKYQDNEGG